MIAMRPYRSAPPIAGVYFVQGIHGGPIKIGQAKDVSLRLKSLQGGFPFKLHVLGVVAGGASEERALHKQYAAYRLQGEWFAPADEIVAYVRDNRIDARRIAWPRKPKPKPAPTLSFHLPAARPALSEGDVALLRDIASGAVEIVGLRSRLGKRALAIAGATQLIGMRPGDRLWVPCPGTVELLATCHASDPGATS